MNRGINWTLRYPQLPSMSSPPRVFRSPRRAKAMLGLGHESKVEAEVMENGNTKDSRMVHGRDGDD
jgi:hypothetical protein